MGIVPPLVFVPPPIRAAGLMAMNCVAPILGMLMIVFGAKTGILAAALVVGMYVMGRNVVGQDWFPGAATS